MYVARELFFRDGYGATSMSSIARIARASKSTLYARFPSKAALLRAIVANQISDWESGPYRVQMQTYDTLEETLRAFVGITLQAGSTREFLQMHRLLYSESGRFPELGEIAAGRLQRGAATIEEYILAFAERDGVPCLDACRAAEHLMMLIQGWMSSNVLANRPIDAKAHRAWLDHAIPIFVSSRARW